MVQMYGFQGPPTGQSGHTLRKQSFCPGFWCPYIFDLHELPVADRLSESHWPTELLGQLPLGSRDGMSDRVQTG